MPVPAYNPDRHRRQSIRLPGYDYAQPGHYFITTCCQNRRCLLAQITGANPSLVLHEAGQMVAAQWLALPGRFPRVQMHEFVVMPNHFHAILEITEQPVGAALVAALDVTPDQKGQPQGWTPPGAPTNKTLADVVNAFKSLTTVEYIQGVKTRDWPPFDRKLWQRDYYKHIIRHEADYQRIANYIADNPARWHEDRFYDGSPLP